MIKEIIALLKTGDFYGQGELIDIAKGKYKKTSSVSEMWKQSVRTVLMKQTVK